MPLITIHTAQRLTNAQKENLKCGLGRIITIIPEKEERMLMVDIGDQHDIYFRGKKCESAAFVEVRVKGRIDLQIKSEVTEAVFEKVNIFPSFDLLQFPATGHLPLLYFSRERY